MPTRKIFDLIIVTWILGEVAWGLPMLWAHRKSSSPNSGKTANLVANTIEAVH